LVMTLDWL